MRDNTKESDRKKGIVVILDDLLGYRQDLNDEELAAKKVALLAQNHIHNSIVGKTQIEKPSVIKNASKELHEVIPIPTSMTKGNKLKLDIPDIRNNRERSGSFFPDIKHSSLKERKYGPLLKNFVWSSHIQYSKEKKNRVKVIDKARQKMMLEKSKLPELRLRKRPNKLSAKSRLTTETLSSLHKRARCEAEIRVEIKVFIEKEVTLFRIFKLGQPMSDIIALLEEEEIIKEEPDQIEIIVNETRVSDLSLLLFDYEVKPTDIVYVCSTDKNKQIKQESFLPNVSLKYKTVPSYSKLVKLKEYELKKLRGLQVSNEHGVIKFSGLVDYRKADIDNDIVLEKGIVKVYPEIKYLENRPQPGEKLNKASNIIFKNISTPFLKIPEDKYMFGKKLLKKGIILDNINDEKEEIHISLHHF